MEGSRILPSTNQKGLRAMDSCALYAISYIRYVSYIMYIFLYMTLFLSCIMKSLLKYTYSCSRFDKPWKAVGAM